MRLFSKREQDSLGGRRIEFVEENDGNPMLWRRDDEECKATFWAQLTPGTTYWRCLVPARHLPGQAIQFHPGFLQEDEDGPYATDQRGDTAIWQFLGDEVRSRIALGLRQVRGYRTLMEVDDNYLRPAPYFQGLKTAPWSKTMQEARDKGGGYSNEGHRMVSPLVDGIICATEYLADIYSEYNDNIYVCPNSIDLDDWQYEREPHDAFRIVYYGSTSHIVDSPIVTKALKWASRQPGVEIYTVGFANRSWSFPHTVVPWSKDLAEARSHLFKFDLGIAPLKANNWSNGKSDIKALEYATAGVLPFMSAVEPYSPWSKVAPDLVLADTDWEDAIRWAVKNPDEVASRAAEARGYVLRERTIQSNIHLWEEALDA